MLGLTPFPHCADRFRYSGALFLVPTEGEAEGMRSGPGSSLCGDALPHMQSAVTLATTLRPPGRPRKISPKTGNQGGRLRAEGAY
jgi:hypothetical protein